MTLLNGGSTGQAAGGGLVRFVLRLVLLAAGLVFAASLLVAMLLLAMVWVLRAGWARLTGRPVTPWVMRVDPRAGWQRATRAGPWAPAARAPGPQQRATPADVTDVEVKDVVPREPRA